MPAIRSSAEIAKKWGDVTPTRAAYYKSGVQSPKKDWATEAKAAESAYEEGVQGGISRKAYGKGVDKAGTSKWKEKSVNVGVGRWPAGVRVAEKDYQAGFAPYRDAIEAVDIGPSYPKGDPRNYEKVKLIGEALHNLKIGA